MKILRVLSLGLVLAGAVAMTNGCSAFKGGVSEDDAIKWTAAGNLAGRTTATVLLETLKPADLALAKKSAIAAQSALISDSPSFTKIETALRDGTKQSRVIANGIVSVRETLILFDVDITDAIEKDSPVYLAVNGFFSTLIQNLEDVEFTTFERIA